MCFLYLKHEAPVMQVTWAMHMRLALMASFHVVKSWLLSKPHAQKVVGLCFYVRGFCGPSGSGCPCMAS